MSASQAAVLLRLCCCCACAAWYFCCRHRRCCRRRRRLLPSPQLARHRSAASAPCFASLSICHCGSCCRHRSCPAIALQPACPAVCSNKYPTPLPLLSLQESTKDREQKLAGTYYYRESLETLLARFQSICCVSLKYLLAARACRNRWPSVAAAAATVRPYWLLRHGGSWVWSVLRPAVLTAGQLAHRSWCWAAVHAHGVCCHPIATMPWPHRPLPSSLSTCTIYAVVED